MVFHLAVLFCILLYFFVFFGGLPFKVYNKWLNCGFRVVVAPPSHCLSLSTSLAQRFSHFIFIFSSFFPPSLHHSITPSSLTPSFHHSITLSLHPLSLHPSITPSLHPSITSSLHHSITPSLHPSLHPFVASLNASESLHRSKQHSKLKNTEVAN